MTQTCAGSGGQDARVIARDRRVIARDRRVIARDAGSSISYYALARRLRPPKINSAGKLGREFRGVLAGLSSASARPPGVTHPPPARPPAVWTGPTVPDAGLSANHPIPRR